MVAGDAFSMRGYVREHARDFTLETHPFFVGGRSCQEWWLETPSPCGVTSGSMRGTLRWRPTRSSWGADLARNGGWRRLLHAGLRPGACEGLYAGDPPVLRGGPILPGMVAGDAFSMRGYVREHARDFTL